MLMAFRLWSAVYGPIQGAISNCFGNLEMPAPENLWTASSATEWQSRKHQSGHKSTPLLQTVIESMFSDAVPPCSGLASMCQIVGLLMYADEVRKSSEMSPSDLNDHLGQAIDNWTRSHVDQEHEYADSLSFPAAAYARLSLEVNIEGAMQAFVNKDFESMRNVLKNGNLIEAARHGMNGLVPWAVSHKNQISMVSVPCGESQI